MLHVSGREDTCVCVCVLKGAFVMHKGVRMKESESVDECFFFSEIPMMLTSFSEQIALVLRAEERRIEKMG